MKRAFILVLMVCFCLVVNSVFAGSLAVSDRNLILTEGSAEVMGQNDSATIFIAVVTEGPKLEKASSENANKTKAVVTTLKGLNIKHLKLETSNYRVTPQRDYKARPPKITGYEVNNSIAVTLEGFETESLSSHVSRIVGKALESGSNTVQRIQFYLHDKSTLEKKALKLATQEAGKHTCRGRGCKTKRHCFAQHTADVFAVPALYDKGSQDGGRCGHNGTAHGDRGESYSGSGQHCLRNRISATHI